MSTPSINYYVINLTSQDERRAFMQRQALSLGINFSFIEAIPGASLTKEQLKSYDATTRHRCMARELTRNEIACVLSHRKALQTFLESGSEFGVILEDDAELRPHFVTAVHEATEHWHGWEVAKLYTNEGALYPLMRPEDAAAAYSAAGVQAVLPRKIMWNAMGFLYSRSGAQKVVEGLQRFWRPADPQIGLILLTQHIPTLGFSPSPIVLSKLNEVSTIDHQGTETERWKSIPKRSVLQYLRYRLHVLHIAFAKSRMRKLMRKRLSRC